MNKNVNQRGVAMLAMVVLVIMLAAIVSIKKTPSPASLEEERVKITKERITKIQNAFKAYYNSSTPYKLPCPASRTAAPGNAGYGTARATCSNSTDANCISGGIACTSAITANSVAIGAVPVRTLNLSDDYMFDGWGRRFIYAVDGDFTVDATTGTSQVRITDKGVDVSANQKYALISAGRDGKGAYSRSGSVFKACPSVGSSVSTAGFDAVNCQVGISSSGVVKDFNYGYWDVAGTSYYDDIAVAHKSMSSSGASGGGSGSSSGSCPAQTLANLCDANADGTADPECVLWWDFSDSSSMSKLTYTSVTVSITRSGSSATATFSAPHGFATGNFIKVTGAYQPEYDGTFTVTSTTPTSLTFNVGGTPATPATGDIVLASTTDATKTYSALGITSLQIASGTTARMTFPGSMANIPNYFPATPLDITISGATPTGYNGNYTVAPSAACPLSSITLMSQGLQGGGCIDFGVGSALAPATGNIVLTVNKMLNQITDKSGNKHHGFKDYSTYVGTARPLISSQTLNGKSMLDPGGAFVVSSNNLAFSSKNATVFGVWKPTMNSFIGSLYTLDEPGPIPVEYWLKLNHSYGGTSGIYAGKGGVASTVWKEWLSNLQSPPMNVWEVSSHVYNESANTMKLYLNGYDNEPKLTVGTNGTPSAGAWPTTRMILGRDARKSGQPLPSMAYMANFIIYNKALSQTERKNVESCLSSMYNITPFGSE